MSKGIPKKGTFKQNLYDHITHWHKLTQSVPEAESSIDKRIEHSLFITRENAQKMHRKYHELNDKYHWIHHCKYCGVEIQGDSMYCEKCGKMGIEHP